MNEMDTPASPSSNQHPHAEGGTSPPVVADDLVTTIKLFGVSGSAVEIRIPDAGRDMRRPANPA